MQKWAKLTPEQREQARERYRSIGKLASDRARSCTGTGPSTRRCRRAKSACSTCRRATCRRRSAGSTSRPPRRSRSEVRPARVAVSGAAGDAAPAILRRLASLLYEAILLFAVAFLATWLFQFAARHAPSSRAGACTCCSCSCSRVFAAYFLWCWLRGGQTLAMKTWRIRLVAKDGHGRLAPKAALLRFLYALLLVPTAIGLALGAVSTATGSSCTTASPAPAASGASRG